MGHGEVRGMLRRWALVGATVAALAAGGCQSLSPPPSPGASGTATAPQTAKSHQPLLGLTRSQEIQVGREGAAALVHEAGEVRNPALTESLTRIANRLAPHTAEPTYRYQVHLLGSNDVNAMSLPDGTVFVTRGFITQLHPTEEDYAAVLGHEISHVAQHHLSHRVAAQREGGIALTLLALLSGRRRAVIAGQVLSSLAQLQFSRSEEYEADQKGADALAATGYNPVAMVHLLQKLERLHPSPPRLQIGFSNHPATRDRIARVQDHILRVTEARR
jgi:predicted Zn-dependent protease